MHLKNINFSIIAIIFLLPILFLSACSETSKGYNSKKTVALSSFVLYDITKHIAGDTFNLVKVIPSGVDIHAYEPSPKTMTSIYSSDLLFYYGVELEPWMKSVSLKKRSVAMNQFLRLERSDKGHNHEGHSGKCNHGSIDPHIWFDIANMKEMARIITYELTILMPRNKTMYLNNRDGYLVMLDRLDKKYKKKLSSCKKKAIVTEHNAFSYLAQAYDFEIKPLKGLSPDIEASPKDIVRTVKDIKAYDIGVVFYEDFSSDKIMGSIASQAKVKISSLHTLGNTTKDDEEKQSSYESLMYENLEKISEALECQ